MAKSQILPAVLIAIQFGASLTYFVDGDIKKGLYWLFAAGLTIVVTF